MSESNLYLKCKWYIPDGLCKIPNCSLNPSKCISMEELDPFCAWLIQFLDYEKVNDYDTIKLPKNFEIDVDQKQTDLNTLINTIYEMLGY